MSVAPTPRPAEGVVSWNINTACNYRCSYCTQRFKEDRGRWSRDTPRFLEAFGRLPGRWEIKLSGGEPFVHPTLDEIVAGLAALGHRVSVVTNFSAPLAKLLRFVDAARGRAGVFSCSLHLEYVEDLEAFIDKARAVAAALWEAADPSLPAPRLCVTSVATRAALPRLPAIAARFAARDVVFKVQPEKQDREVIAYAPDEEVVILGLGGHNLTGRIVHAYAGRPCWSGARYFILDDEGTAYRCYPARRVKIERMGDFLSPTFTLAEGPSSCLYRQCNCTVPIARGMMPRDGAASELAVENEMKFRTFRIVVAAGTLLAAGALVFALFGRPKRERPPEKPAPAAESARSEPTPPPAAEPEPVRAPEPPSGTLPLRPIDGRIIDRLSQPISGSDKVKDAFKSEAIKVNLYQDAGQRLPNRVKVDLDRDEKWDEKWTVEGVRVLREVSSADDDKTYDQRFLLAAGGAGWQREGAAPAEAPAAPPVTEPAAPAAGEALRAMDREILDLARAGISGDRVKDATAGKPYKVSLYRDAGSAGVNRLKLDLDRDEKWDEKWTFDGDDVKRQVAPADDESYTDEYRLRAGAWVKK